MIALYDYIICREVLRIETLKKKLTLKPIEVTSSIILFKNTSRGWNQRCCDKKGISFLANLLVYITSCICCVFLRAFLVNY